MPTLAATCGPQVLIQEIEQSYNLELPTRIFLFLPIRICFEHLLENVHFDIPSFIIA
jgi:hypothetical protein